MVERDRASAAPSIDEHRVRVGHEVGTPAELLPALRPFWRAVYGEAPALLGFFSGHREGSRLVAPRESYFLWPGGAHHAAAWLVEEVARARDVYQYAHLLTRPRRLKRHAAPLAALYVALDHATLGHPAVPEPSLIVQSSPGRLQCYWQLREPLAPATGEALNRRLAYALGADRSGWDLTQLLRIPGTPNRKYPDAPVVSVLAQSGRRYDGEVLASSLPDLELQPADPDDSEPGRPLHPGARAVGLDHLPLTDAARRILGGDLVVTTADGRLDRSASLVRMARVLRGAGVPPGGIAATLAERDASLGWRKHADRPDAARQYARIVSPVSQ